MKFGLNRKDDHSGSEGRETSEDEKVAGIASEDEKVVGVKQGDFEALDHRELLPDPDAHLTDAERAQIVCASILSFH